MGNKTLQQKYQTMLTEAPESKFNSALKGLENIADASAKAQEIVDKLIRYSDKHSKTYPIMPHGRAGLIAKIKHNRECFIFAKKLVESLPPFELNKSTLTPRFFPDTETGYDALGQAYIAISLIW